MYLQSKIFVAKRHSGLGPPQSGIYLQSRFLVSRGIQAKGHRKAELSAKQIFSLKETFRIRDSAKQKIVSRGFQTKGHLEVAVAYETRVEYRANS